MMSRTFTLITFAFNYSLLVHGAENQLGSSAPQLSSSFIAHLQGAVSMPRADVPSRPKKSALSPQSTCIRTLTTYLKESPPVLVKHLTSHLSECSALLLLDHKIPIGSSVILTCANKLGSIIQLAQQTLYKENLKEDDGYTQAQRWYYNLIKQQYMLLDLLG